MTTGRAAALQKQLEESETYLDYIEAAAREAGVPPALLWAIGSRESGWGIYLEPKGPAGKGDGGHGHGLLQLDNRWYGDWLAENDWTDPATIIRKGATVLGRGRRYLKARHDIRGDALDRATAAAYNGGPRSVDQALDEGRPVDSETTGDYAVDVVSRMQWFETETRYLA